jgi:hypothetical protein
MNASKFLSPVTRLAVCALIAGAVPQAFAEVKVEVGKPKFDDLQSPQFAGNTTSKKNFKPKDWLEVEVKFSVTDSNSKAKFADRVSVHWYVAVKNPEGKGGWLIEKQITHVNVPLGEDIYSSVYLSPSAVLRLSGRKSASKGVVEFVGGEIEVNGKRINFVSKGSDKDPFWNKLAGSLSRTDKVPLFNKNETPFKALWYDRYAEIEQLRR